MSGEQRHGGELAMAALAGYGVKEIFTLSGGHIFSIYDGAVKLGVRIVDVRHEQTATVAAAIVAALTPHRGPTFLDFPLDVVFGSADTDGPAASVPSGRDPDPDEVARAAELIATAERPALVAGSDLWWDGAWDELRAAVEHLRVPTFVNGLGRGCLAADHELAFARTRRFLKAADVVVVVGTPLDFRLSFGSFGSAQVIHVVDADESRAPHITAAASPAGHIPQTPPGFPDYP